MRLAPAMVSVCGGLLVGACALTLDYAPPDPIGMDGGARDSSIREVDVGADAETSHDAALPPDAQPSDAGHVVDVGALDASSDVDASRPVDGGLDASGPASGECANDGDCPGGACVALSPGGYHLCLTPPVPATHCTAIGVDECCDTGDCSVGQTCYLGPVHQVCGGAFMVPSNVCAADECASSADCGGGVCAPAGTLAPVATCLSAACRRDSDCTDEVGGHCILARDRCCNIPVGLVCTYASDGCRTALDCVGGYCELDSGRARCVDGVPLPCPF